MLLGALLAMLVITGASLGARTAPPIEELTVDRMTLPAPGQIVVDVTNGGADPVTIAQVIYEVGRLITRQSREDGAPVLSGATFGGLIAGIAIMYATSLLVAG